MSRVLAWLAPCLVLTACESTFQTDDSTIESANAALGAGRVDDAKKGYDEAATFLPESPSLNYLRGLAASATGDHKAAHDLLLRALDTKDKLLEQRVKAALGLAYAREAISLERTGATPPPDAPPQPGEAEASAPTSALETWKLAVGFLEDALVMDPNDLESRRTLEVALLRVDPPCSTRDDELEPNDTREDAKLLEVGAEESAEAPRDPQAPAQPKDVLRLRKQLFSCPDDDDWYALELADGDRVELGVTIPKDAGKLAFTVFAPNGDRYADIAPTGDKLRFTVTANQAGRWTIQATNVDLDEVSYGLEVVVRPACGKSEDTFEDNDSAFTAKMVTPGSVPNLKACPGNEDWYSLVLADGESLFLYAQPEPPKDDEKKDKEQPTAPGLELEILDEQGVVRAQGAPTGLARVSTLLTPGPGRYLIRVRSAATGFGPDKTEPFEGRYALQVEIVPPCPEGDDRFEDNDLPEDATDFMQAAAPPESDNAGQPDAMQLPQQSGPPIVFARVCPGDADWWSFTGTGEKPEIITATFDHAKGDLDLVLYDELGTNEIARSDASSAEQNGEVVALPIDEELAKKKQAGATDADVAPTPKTWKLLVRGRDDDAQNFYLLRLDQPSGGGGDSSDDGDPEEREPQDQNDQADPKQDQKDQQDPQDQPQNPLQDALDNLDKNPENLPAKDAANRSPLANQKPLKDW